MNILGIHEGHNASIALFQKNRITYAVSEERLSKVKNDGGFPQKSIERMLSDTGLSMSSLDAVALCGKRAVQPKWAKKEPILKRYQEYCSYDPGPLSQLRESAVKRLPEKTVDSLRRAFRRESVGILENFEIERMNRLKQLRVPSEKIIRVDHHECHASAAYYGYGDYSQPILTLTCDGGGDGICASVNIGKQGKLKRLGAIPHADSIAKLYGLITYVMGFVPLEHEYKLMGMSPYAAPNKVGRICEFLEDKFEWFNNGIPKWERKKGLRPTSYWYPLIREVIEFERFDIVAASFQLFIEKIMTRWIGECIKEVGIPRLALSGGIFMNVKMNKLLMEMQEVEAIFVHPSCGDETNPFGACYVVAIQLGVDPLTILPLKDLYLGPVYGNDLIRKTVEKCAQDSGIEMEMPGSIETRVAEILADGNVVARYNGREEFGARSLGNRSILADPSKLDLIKEINKMIKDRDFWMPFAGTMTAENAKENLFNPKGVRAPYMIMTFDACKNVAEFEAATHPYDQTIRPQVLDETWNPSYHKILTKFQRITGKKGGILNTSFNLHGYPIVSAPGDAIDVFLESGLRYLAMGPYLLSKS